ncbi:MAG TPA: hypothetical protein VLQ48_09640 [Chloroflexia bacterium]|nr:hypothetical protein [Chloroflexia bacterium]
MRTMKRTGTMRSFPKRYKLINELVAGINLYYALSPDDFTLEERTLYPQIETAEYRYYNFFVTLKDGRAFGFCAWTPELVREYMDERKELSFVNSGLLMVSEISIEAVLDALENCLDQARLYGLEHFGFRSNRQGDVEKRFKLNLGRRVLDMRVTLLRKWPVKHKVVGTMRKTEISR